MHLSFFSALFCATTLTSALVARQTPNNASSKLPALLDADLEELNAGLSNGLFTSVDLVNAYTARIMEVNSTLHMVTEINPGKSWASCSERSIN